MIRLEAKELSRIAAERSGAHIGIDDRIMAGLACVTGTRMPVQTVVIHLAYTSSVETVLDDHPKLDAEDVRLVSVSVRGARLGRRAPSGGRT